MGYRVPFQCLSIQMAAARLKDTDSICIRGAKDGFQPFGFVTTFSESRHGRHAPNATPPRGNNT